MTQVLDPVCGMTIDSANAAATSQRDGQTVYFCSPNCKTTFDADPARYGSAAAPLADAADAGGEPRFTKTGEVVAPKFGSAGSGGAEYERLPHERDAEGR